MLSILGRNRENGYIQLLRLFLETEDQKILFILTFICATMIIDLLTGNIAAKVNPDIEFKSELGINGALRKIIIVILLMFFISLSVIVSGATGTVLVYTLYAGYLLMELKSVLENYQKLGSTIDLFQHFLDL